MLEKDAIVKTARSARIILWGCVIFILLCLAGVPTFFAIDIEPLHSDTWIMAAMTLLDHFLGTPNFPIVLAAGDIVLFMIFVVCMSAFLGVLIWNMDRLFRQFTLGHIFTPKSIRYLSRIGWTLIALCLITTFGDNVIEYQMADLFYQQTPDLMMDGLEKHSETGHVSDFFTLFISLDFSLLVAGLFVVTLARVMRLGTQLQDDVDSTI